MNLSSGQMVSNILHVYGLATREDISRGIQWYPLAHNIMVEWAATFGRSIANVSCVTAALSPQLPWERCLIIADDVLHGNPPSIGGSLNSNLRKAKAIRDTHASDTVGYFINGCKVRCFATNLAGNMDIVTVDTHAAQIASGDVRNTLRVDTWKRYEPVASAYVDAAKRVSPVTKGRKHIEPAFLQAITWLTWKRLYPHKQNQRRRF